MRACLASFGEWDCQACRNRGFNYKYCWCPTFQVNKQQSAYIAGFSAVLIRLLKFKSLRGEPSCLSGFVFLHNFNRTGTRPPYVCIRVCACVHVCLSRSSVFICQKYAFLEWAVVWLWKSDNTNIAPLWKRLKGDKSLSTWPSALLKKIAKYVI